MILARTPQELQVRTRVPGALGQGSLISGSPSRATSRVETALLTRRAASSATTATRCPTMAATIGWRTRRSRRLARRRTVGNLSMRLDAFAGAAVRPVYQGTARRIALGTPRAAARVERLRATLASYSGHLRHGAAFGDWDRAWRRYRWLGALFARRGWQVAARWPPRPLARAGRFAEQYWQLVRRAGPRCLVFC